MIKLKLDTSRKERQFRRQFATNIRLTVLLSSNPLRKTKYVIKGYVSVRVDRLT